MKEGFKDKAGSALLGELIVLLAQNEGIRRALSELPDAESDRILRDVVAGVQKLLHSVRPVSYGGRTPTPHQATPSAPGPAVTSPQSPSVPAPAERPKTLQDLLSGSAGTISKAPGLEATGASGAQAPPSPPAPAPSPAVPSASLQPASTKRTDLSQTAGSGTIPQAPVPPVAAQRADLSQPAASPAIPPAPAPPAGGQRDDVPRPDGNASVSPKQVLPPATLAPPVAPRADGIRASWGSPLAGAPAPAAAVSPVSAPSAAARRTDILQPTESTAVLPVSRPAVSGQGADVSKPTRSGAIPPAPVPPLAAQRADLSQPAASPAIPPAPVPPAVVQRADVPHPEGSASVSPTQALPPLPPPAPPRTDGLQAGWGSPLAGVPAPSGPVLSVSVPPAAAQRTAGSKPTESGAIPPAPVPPAADQRTVISKPRGSAPVTAPAVRRKDTASSAEADKETSPPNVNVSGAMVIPPPSRAEEKLEGISEPAGGAPGMDTGIRRRGEEQRTPCTFEEELAYVHAVALIPFTESPSVDPFLLDESGLEDERQVMVVDLAGLRFYLSLIRADSPSVSKSGLLLLSKQDALRMRYDHERVLNNLRLRGSLLPAEFGTVVHGRDGLLRRAELRHSALLELVVQLSSIERWDLSVSVLDAKLARTLTGGAGTSRGSGREAGRSRGTRGAKGLDVKTLERLLNREKKLAQSILESIAAVAERHTVEFQIGLGGGMSDDWKLILRACFTVSPANMPRFHQAIVEVQNLHPLEEPMLHLVGTTESFSLSM